MYDHYVSKTRCQQIVKEWNRTPIIHNGIKMTLATLRKLEQMQKQADAELQDWLKWA